MKIQITFLGTAQAIPTATRNHTAILLQYKDENILVDCGEGTQRQFRKAKLNPCNLTKILITHWHGDHVLGLPGLLQTLALNNYKKTLHVYGPKRTKEFMNQLYKIFVPVGKLKLEIHEITGKFFENKDFELIALPLIHGAPCNGYVFQEKEKLRINKNKLKKLKLEKKHLHLLKQLTEGKNITISNRVIKSKDFTYLEKGKKISFILDTKICPNISKLVKESDLAVTEATYSKNEEELASQYKHNTAEQAAKIAKKEKVKKLILTHLSQRFEHKENIILNEAKKIFKNTILAEDLMRVEV